MSKTDRGSETSLPCDNPRVELRIHRENPLRIVPVSEGHTGFSLELCREISAGRIRCDVDDRNETVAKKIRRAEREWVPYILVVGQIEVDSDLFSVRIRKTGNRREMSLSGLVGLLAEEQGEMPFRPPATPVSLSFNPTFFG